MQTVAALKAEFLLTSSYKDGDIDDAVRLCLYLTWYIFFYGDSNRQVMDL